MQTEQIVSILNAAKTLMAKSVTLTEKDGELKISIEFANFLEFSKAENVPIVYPASQEKPIPVSPVVAVYQSPFISITDRDFNEYSLG